MDKTAITPPRVTKLPDYFLGRLIFFDEYSSDAMKYVVYDGREFVRCVSRKAAERYCAEKQNCVGHEAITQALVSMEHLRISFRTLDNAASRTHDTEARLVLEGFAFHLRKAYDKIDTYIKQHQTTII